MCSSSEGSHSREVYSADRCDEICDVVRTNMNYTLHELRDICSRDRKAFKADKADRARVTNLLKVAEDDRPKTFEGLGRRIGAGGFLNSINSKQPAKG